MSDNLGINRSDSGNFRERLRRDGRGEGNDYLYSRRRVLVEESASISIEDIRKICGRSKMLQAADRGLTIPISLNGKHLEVYMTFDIHRLPSRQVRWADPSDGNVRLWMVCPRCRHRAKKLYLEHPPLSDSELKLGCRKCLGLRYQSQHCGGNTWWKMSARPIRRLLRRRNKLLARKPGPRVSEELDHIEKMIWLFRQRAVPKSPKRSSRETKRPYRDVDLVFGLF